MEGRRDGGMEEWRVSVVCVPVLCWSLVRYSLSLSLFIFFFSFFLFLLLFLSLLISLINLILLDKCFSFLFYLSLKELRYL